MNTGTKLVQSNHGLISTICYQFPNKSPVYALEGSIAVAGSGIEWLKNNLNLIQKTNEMNELANQVNDTGGVYFVPSFTGLFAPYWNSNVRGTIVGLSLYTKKEHICRAMLEAIAFQTKEVVDAMLLDSNIKLNKLKVDGGMSKSDIAMQLISDILGTNVLKPEESEMTALGAAVCAGLGIGLWKDVQHVPFDGKDFKEFKPTIQEEERNEKIKLWKLAVKSACVFQQENL
jgi:glycerol kinase